MNRLVCLDGLRGLLAVYVMAGHMARFAPLPEWLQSALSHGTAAVDMFFVLSGLVIVRSLTGVSWRARPFLIARVFRIFPAYLPALALALAVQSIPSDFNLMPWIAPDDPTRAVWPEGWPATWKAEIVAHLTMTHGLFPAGILPDAWISFLRAAWSLSTEWQFYVLVLLAGRAPWIRARMGARMGTGTDARMGSQVSRSVSGADLPGLGTLAAGFLALGVAAVAWQVLAPAGWQFSRAFLPNKAQYFALGIASARLLADRSWRPYAIVLVVTVALSGVAGPGKTLPPLAWTLCLAAALGVPGLGPIRRLLSARPMLWLGALSYSIYLLNEPVQKPLGVLLARVAGGDGMLFTLLWCPLAMLIPIGLAMLLHHAVELPGLRLGRRLARQSSPPPARLPALREA